MSGARTAAPAAPRRGRGRRPVERVRADVMELVASVLLTEGLGALTIDRVARESGVSRTTIYKLWPSIGSLALDGYFHAVEQELAFPDTGDIRADLTSQLRSFTRLMTTTPAGRIVLELIGRAQTDPDLAVEFRRMYSSHRRRLATHRMREAQEAGQLRPDLDLESLVDQLWGAVYHRLLVPDQPVDEAFAVRLVDNLFRGIGPELTPAGAAGPVGVDQG